MPHNFAILSIKHTTISQPILPGQQKNSGTRLLRTAAMKLTRICGDWYNFSARTYTSAGPLISQRSIHNFPTRTDTALTTDGVWRADRLGSVWSTVKTRACGLEQLFRPIETQRTMRGGLANSCWNTGPILSSIAILNVYDSNDHKVNLAWPPYNRHTQTYMSFNLNDLKTTADDSSLLNCDFWRSYYTYPHSSGSSLLRTNFNKRALSFLSCWLVFTLRRNVWYKVEN
jgi:hypothetical protein